MKGKALCPETSFAALISDRLENTEQSDATRSGVCVAGWWEAVSARLAPGTVSDFIIRENLNRVHEVKKVHLIHFGKKRVLMEKFFWLVLN